MYQEISGDHTIRTMDHFARNVFRETTISGLLPEELRPMQLTQTHEQYATAFISRANISGV